MSENDADADMEPEGLVVGECELTQEGVQWLADFDSRPVGSRTRMVELYIMIHGVPFDLENLLNWLGNQLVTRRNEYLHGPSKSGASGGNQNQSRMKSNIQQMIADNDTEAGYKQPTNPLLVRRVKAGTYFILIIWNPFVNETQNTCVLEQKKKRRLLNPMKRKQRTRLNQQQKAHNCHLLRPCSFSRSFQDELDEDRQEGSAQETLRRTRPTRLGLRALFPSLPNLGRHR